MMASETSFDEPDLCVCRLNGATLTDSKCDHPQDAFVHLLASELAILWSAQKEGLELNSMLPKTIGRLNLMVRPPKDAPAGYCHIVADLRKTVTTENCDFPTLDGELQHHLETHIAKRYTPTQTPVVSRVFVTSLHKSRSTGRLDNDAEDIKSWLMRLVLEVTIESGHAVLSALRTGAFLYLDKRVANVLWWDPAWDSAPPLPARISSISPTVSREEHKRSPSASETAAPTFRKKRKVIDTALPSPPAENLLGPLPAGISAAPSLRPQPSTPSSSEKKKARNSRSNVQSKERVVSCLPPPVTAVWKKPPPSASLPPRPLWSSPSTRLPYPNPTSQPPNPIIGSASAQGHARADTGTLGQSAMPTTSNHNKSSQLPSPDPKPPVVPDMTQTSLGGRHDVKHEASMNASSHGTTSSVSSTKQLPFPTQPSLSVQTEPDTSVQPSAKRHLPTHHAQSNSEDKNRTASTMEAVQKERAKPEDEIVDLTKDD